MSELMPLSYGRSFWNTIHQTNLEDFEGPIPPEKLQEINEVYDIRLYLGVHGRIQKTEDRAFDLAVRPTQNEYEAAKEVVEGLRPTDTLFIENFGYEAQAPPPISYTNMLLRQQMTFGLTPPLQDRIAQKQYALDDLEALRQNYLISTWDYAYKLARLGGVRTVFADQDAYQYSLLVELFGGNFDITNLYTAPEGETLASRVHRAREKRVAKTVAHCALQFLSLARSRYAQRKTILGVMFGAAHDGGLQDAFDGEGLQYSVHRMRSTKDLTARLIEHANHTAQQMWPADQGTWKERP